MKAIVGAFNQEKALVGAFSVIAQLHRLIVYSTSVSGVSWEPQTTVFAPVDEAEKHKTQKICINYPK